MCKKYFAPDETYHSSRNHISKSPAPLFVLLQVNSRNEKAPSSQPNTVQKQKQTIHHTGQHINILNSNNLMYIPNSSAQNQRHYICDKECVENLLREERIVSNFSLANAVCFLLWMLKFPVPLNKP